MAKQQNNAQVSDGNVPSDLLADLQDSIEALEDIVSDEEIVDIVTEELNNDTQEEAVETPDVIEDVVDAPEVAPEAPEAPETPPVSNEDETPVMLSTTFRCTGSKVMWDRVYDIGELMYNVPDEMANSLLSVNAVERV